MSRTDGEKTKKKILRAAERLFSKKGFHGTSVAEISREADVNKALIYYHFKDKNDIIVSLFRNIIEELEQSLDQSVEADDSLSKTEKVRLQIEGELRYLAGRKRIIAVMLMETLKSANADDFLFQCSEIVMHHEGGYPSGSIEKIDDTKRHRYLSNEFFTGFIPMISFVVFQDKWCEYFKCAPEKALGYFLEAFERSHLAQ
jgi:AcrR family transcriptional regulator